MHKTLLLSLAATLMLFGNSVPAGPVFTGACDITGYGHETYFGVEFEFNGSGFGSLTDPVSLEWTHQDITTGDVIEILGADVGYCDVNGLTQGTFYGLGNTTVNGVPGYNGYIRIVDNRTPTLTTIEASLSKPPIVRTDGHLIFGTPMEVTIPYTIKVLSLSATCPAGAERPSLGQAALTLDDLVCTYRADGANYTFERCNRLVMPGDVINISEAKLRVKQGNPGDSLTHLQAVLSITPGVGSPDTYYLLVTDSTGADVYVSQVTPIVGSGDIDIMIRP